MLTVEIDRREDPFVYKHPYQLFALSKQMVTSLTEVAQEVRVEIVSRSGYARIRRIGSRESEMAFWKRNISFIPEENTVERRCGQFLFMKFIHHRTRHSMWPEEIRRLVREKGYRYREIAVIASDLNTYADSLEKACDVMRFRFFMDHKKSILLNSFVEYLRSLLVMVEQNYTYESVFRYLRTGLCGFTRDEVERLENYCLAWI